MKKIIRNIVPVAALALTFGLASCVNDLDVTPLDDDRTTDYDVNALFTKCYSVLALEGNEGADAASDIDGMDGGMSGFIRQMCNANNLTTDEVISWWGDPGISEYCYNTYGPGHPMLNGYYSRLTTAINFDNTYLAVASDHDATMTAEVRFLRALEYYYLMDAFGNVPFATSPLTTPSRMARADMYEWLINEINEIEPLLPAAKAKKSTDIGYGRVDKAAAWMLLARLYLNAEVYTGKAEWAKAAEYAKKVMDSDYRLNTEGKGGWSAYQMLFMGDNGETDAAYEAIFPLLADGIYATGYAHSFFLMASTFDGDMHENPNSPEVTNGTSETWSGYRARPQFVAKFFENTADVPELPAYLMYQIAGDDRALFNNIGHTLSTGDNTGFKQGWGIAKFNNFKTDGSIGHDTKYPDTDFFLMRVAEAYLTYAEAMARQNGNVATGEAASAINAIRNRAHASTKDRYTMNEILDEWSREFYFEGRRRVDLIRHNKFGGNNGYNWEWKGGTPGGSNFEEYKNIFAIPANQVGGAITQNPGYPVN